MSQTINVRVQMNSEKYSNHYFTICWFISFLLGIYSEDPEHCFWRSAPIHPASCDILKKIYVKYQ